MSTIFVSPNRLTRGIRLAAVVAISLAIAAGAPAAACAQQNIPRHHAFLLVATHDMPDPTFAHTVILMLPPSEIPFLVVGLIVNRPTTIPVKVLFPDSAAMSKDREQAYFGGPVDPTDPSVVVRTESPPHGVLPAFADIYAVFDRDTAAKILKSPGTTKDLRVVVGRSQWSAGQLHREVAEGSWYVEPADANMVFAQDGMRLWQELVGRGKLLETSVERRTVPVALAIPAPPWTEGAP